MEITKGKISWIDITKPKQEDLDFLEKKYKFHKIILKELEHPSARARVEYYKDYLYLIYHFPIYDVREATSRNTEIDFLITKDAVITAHYEKIDELNHFKNLNFESSLDLAYQIIEHLLSFEERQLAHIGEKIETVGRELFHDREKEVLTAISRLKRDVSEYRIIVRRQSPILKSFIEHGTTFWGEKASIYLRSLEGNHLRVSDQVEDYRETISDFEDTNNQLMNVKATEVMKTFTILAFLTFPLMLIAAIFSMKTRDTPFINMPGAFWIVFGIMIISMTTMYRYFRNKDWL